MSYLFSGNPKSEYLNPKQILISNLRIVWLGLLLFNEGAYITGEKLEREAVRFFRERVDDFEASLDQHCAEFLIGKKVIIAVKDFPLRSPGHINFFAF